MGRNIEHVPRSGLCGRKSVAAGMSENVGSSDILHVT